MIAAYSGLTKKFHLQLSVMCKLSQSESCFKRDTRYKSCHLNSFFKESK